MNTYRTRVLIAIQLCSIVLLTLFVVSSASAQTVAKAPANAAAPSQFAERGIIPPPVPTKLQVQAGFEPFLEGHGIGTQNYVCRPSGNGFAFVLFTPQATLVKLENGKELITHFFSPNPFEANVDPTVVGNFQIRVTWQDAHDASRVWAKIDQSATSSTDPAFVAQGAIAWLLLDVVGALDGPIGGGTLTPTMFIQRVNTSGGLAPATGCASSAHIGNEAFVDYTADYIFYKKVGK